VKAVLAAAGHEGGVFNVGTGVETSVNELFRTCARVTGYDREPGYAEARPGEIRRSVIDPARAERELGWRAEQSLEEGLKLTWDTVGAGP
jgi:UDP-glucose 4-epimerase